MRGKLDANPRSKLTSFVSRYTTWESYVLKIITFCSPLNVRATRSLLRQRLVSGSKLLRTEVPLRSGCFNMEIRVI